MAANEKVRLHEGEPTTGCMRYTIHDINPEKPNPFSKWSRRRGTTCCYRIHPEQPVYEPADVINPWSRPTNLPNLWSSKRSDFQDAEWLELSWSKPQKMREVTILFDSMLDFQFSQSWKNYDRNVVSPLVRKYRLLARNGSQSWQTLTAVDGNYQRRCQHTFEPIEISRMRLEVTATHGLNRAQVYALRVYV